MTPFQPLLGQAQAIELLTQAVQKHRIAPAYLFVGPNGVGRSLAARCFLELLLDPTLEAGSVLAGGTTMAGETAVAGGTPTPQSISGSPALRQRIAQGNHPDLLWVEPTYLHQGKRLSAQEAAEAGVKRKAPPQIRLEQIREVSQFLSRAPLMAPRSVVVIEQAETMAEAAANGLLKTLEEPGQATLILLAPSLDALLPTLISRCQRIPFYRLPPDCLAQVLATAGYGHLVQTPGDPAYAAVLAMAQGSPGAAIAHYEQLQNLPPDLLQAVQSPPRSLREALELARQIQQTLESEQQYWLLDYLQQCYWHPQPGYDPSPILHTLEKAKTALRSYVQPRLVWEVTLMQLC
ncbi:DNA polymerase III subunit delta' [Trichothermofontia sp.]